MHASTHNDYDFYYNGDYSGTIKVIDPVGVEVRKSFPELATTALYDSRELPFTEAARGFVALAAVTEAIALLEQMETDEVLANPWLKSLLGEISTN